MQIKLAFIVQIRLFSLLLLPIIKRNKTTVLKNKQLMSHLSLEKTANIFSTYGGSATNTGSIEGQIALLTERINHISNHLKTNKKDFSSQRGLMMMVGQRKRLLSYLSKHDLTGYNEFFPTVILTLGFILYTYHLYTAEKPDFLALNKILYVSITTKIGYV